MKTISYIGGSVLVDDDTADAILDFSTVLAECRRMGTVTIRDHSSAQAYSQVVLTVGLGVPLSVRGAPSVSAETSSDIRERLGALVAPPVIASGADPRSGYDLDYDLPYTFPGADFSF